MTNIGEFPKILIYGFLLICFICIVPCCAQTVAELSDRGYSLYKAGRFDEAIKYYDQALAIEPNNFTILYNKADALFDSAHWDEAEEAYSLAAQNIENSTEINYRYYWATGASGLCRGYSNDGTNALIERNDYAMAVFYFNKVNEICPNYTNNVPLYADKGYALFKLGRYDEALAAYDTAIRISKEKIADYVNNKQYLENKRKVEIDRKKVQNKINEINGISTPTTTPTITPTITTSITNNSNLPSSNEETQRGIPPEETKKAPLLSFTILVSLCIAGSLLVIHRKK